MSQALVEGAEGLAPAWWRTAGVRAVSALAIVLMVNGSAFAALDLRNATVEKLANGLTLITLEDRRFPVVSVQALYRVGARNEVSGQSGLAHFLEHMAFRSSESFPQTDLVDRIYASGGEWHGYTWIDQTTYFSTVPKDDIDLLLRIEADRMHRLNIEAGDMDAERGAVLAEMHMYENSPTSVLIDAVNYIAFLAHPYRNNTIGWESDIRNLKHEDVVAFYRQHYQPGNAVIAVVGDFHHDEIRQRVKALFEAIPEHPPTPLPGTVEPAQNGVRRIEVAGNTGQRHFAIAYRAPSVNDPDFAAFLVLQEILATGSGANFLQNDWGTAVDDDSVLAGAAESLTTWYPPSAQPYVFVIGGIAADGDDQETLERRIEERVASLRLRPASSALLEKAKNDVQDALVFDIETTEDAAHQLAFYDGLQALDVLLTLPQRVAASSARDVQRLAATYLLPEQRSIAWYMPVGDYDTAADGPPSTAARPQAVSPAGKAESSPVRPAATAFLSSGLPAIVQRSDLSTTASVRIVLPGDRLAGATPDEPMLGHSSIARSVRSNQIEGAMLQLRNALERIEPAPQNGILLSMNPETRLKQEFSAIMHIDREPMERVAPSLVVVTGDIDPTGVLDQLEQIFGDFKFVRSATGGPVNSPDEQIAVHLNSELAQAQLGYIVPAPPPGDRGADAYRLLLYVFSHGYGGRFGKKAISESGLAYYIGSQYRSDGSNAWITLSIGVDPGKIRPLSALLSSELSRLTSELPTEAEIAEAKNHLLGRLQTAAQSNPELAAQLATQWTWYGKVITEESLRNRLRNIDRQDIADAAVLFAKGTTITVTE